MSEQEKDPKLIIDEDWKSQVEREKAEAAVKAAQPTDGPPEDAQPAEGIDSAKESAPEVAQSKATEPTESKKPSGSRTQMPPATFDFLVTMLATQSMHALGQIPGPDGKTGDLDKPLAKHYIDLLGVIETKTSGNLDASEKKMLEEILHSMRMMFVQFKD